MALGTLLVHMWVREARRRTELTQILTIATSFSTEEKNRISDPATFLHVHDGLTPPVVHVLPSG